MPLQLGDKLGRYEIRALIGKGGMGEVYRAYDPAADREVAIKVSQAQFSDRFHREARAVASLNHPNICTLFDVGPDYIVLEYVEGPTLADRIQQGPIPLPEALDLARQMAAALEAAHQLPLVHRDFKPANVKIKPNGAVKVLDFGLAKLPASQSSPGSDPADSPTLTMGMTEAGMILGTAGYMSPEQARGETVDKRADVWAFGVVLWEMLTSKRLFQGKTVPDTLAAVIRDEPDIAQAPPKVRTLLHRCLEKDPQRRLRDIGDAMGIIETTPESAPASKRHWAPWAAAAALLIPLGAVSFLHFREQPPPEPAPMRFQIPAPANGKVPLGPLIAISPDGRKLAFQYQSNGQNRLWVHSLDTGESRDLTEAAGSPFWSPDSRFVAFPTADRKLKKIEATGGPTQTICTLTGGWGAGSWNKEDVIIFGSIPGPILKVPAAGGVPVPVTKNDSPESVTHSEPWFLSDGRHFFYSLTGQLSGQSYHIGLLDAKPEEQSTKPLIEADRQPVYAPSGDPRAGYLLFTREGTVMAQPFDNEKLELRGQPIPIAEQVSANGVGGAGRWGAFSASTNGVLVFLRGGSAGNRQLTWFDRQGKPLGMVGDPAPHGDLALSPDGTQVATVHVGTNTDIWLLELARGTSTTFTSDAGAERSPIWSPDGNRIAFGQGERSVGATRYDLHLKPSNGVGEPQVVKQTGAPSSWSRDGRFLLLLSGGQGTKADIGVLSLDGDRTPSALLSTEFNEGYARFSPDGHWIAYSSDESGRNEIYVRPFEVPGKGPPTVGAKRVVSTGGSSRIARWRGDGKELFYLSRDRKLMAVEIATSPVFRAGAPQVLFPTNAAESGWDVSADGKRFLVAVPVGENAAEPYSVVLNWPSLMKR